MSPQIIHLVDDDASFLRATSRMLRASGYEVSIHSSAADLLSGLSPDPEGCVVTDLAMPGIDGIALQQALEQHGSAMPVVFLTAHGDIPSTVRAMRRGAEDFLTKNAPKKDLLAAIERALERNTRERATRARLRDIRRRFDALSVRELEVLRYVVRGRLNKQIAADLGIHERTVKLHRTAVTTKLRVHSAAELANLCRDAAIFAEERSDTFPKGQ